MRPSMQAIEIIAGRFFFTPLCTTEGLRHSEIAHRSLCYNIDNELVSRQWSLLPCCSQMLRMIAHHDLLCSNLPASLQPESLDHAA